MDYINKGLKDTPFTGQHILNFLYIGPEEDRDQDMPNFDWRNIFNLTDQVIRLINRYGEVSLMHKMFQLCTMLHIANLFEASLL